jgi:uncharacterized protein YdiU (UPF0061 family)
MNWNFDNSYTKLPEHFFTRIAPVAVSAPKVAIVNFTLSKQLGLVLEGQDNIANILSGNKLPEGAEPIAQAYAGHQFGHFVILGDGRTHLLGEHITPDGKRFDIQLKGSGKTPYSRRGDGRAALGPMLREYIISEAMHALGIPTTRSLAVVTTGEPVMRESVLQGAILTRVAASHIRVGTFEFLAARKDIDGLKTLADYAINRHYPELENSEQPYLGLLKAVMQRQIELVVHWLRVGFIHGVMNTDNMAISGETIDYGPCAFMDSYDPQTVFSSIDRNGRYSYANQAHIAQWNLARFAEAILPLLNADIELVSQIADEVIQSYTAIFQEKWLEMMRKKLGLFGEKKQDETLIADLLKWMQRNHADYTNTFRDLISEKLPEVENYQTQEFKNWWQQWQARLQQNHKPLKSSFCLMRANNPAIIPRNHKVEEALRAAEENSNLSKLHELLDALAEPYKDKPEFAQFQQQPAASERVYQTFCGT